MLYIIKNEKSVSYYLKKYKNINNKFNIIKTNKQLIDTYNYSFYFPIYLII